MDINVYGEITVYANQKQELNHTSRKDLNTLKSMVKRRDKSCQICGESMKPLEVHHIYPKKMYPELEDDTSNMITLCQACHRKYHNNYDDSLGAVSFVKYLQEMMK